MSCLVPSTRGSRRASEGYARAIRESDRRTNHQVLGAVLLAIGGNWLLAELGLFALGWAGLFAVALMTLGVSMVGTAKAGRTAPLVALGVFLTLGLVMSSGVSNPLKDKAVGDEVYSPQSLSDLRNVYEHDLGDLTLDLRDLRLEGSRDVDVKLGMGDIEVVVPEDMLVRVRAEVGPFGDIELFDAVKKDGWGETGEYQDPKWQANSTGLNLELNVKAFGDIKVVRG